ncbi:MAG: ribonuclease Z [Lutibacter sp.]
MSIKVTILGCHSATPRENAHPTSQVVNIKNKHFLVDCGEGTQIQMRKNKIKFNNIEHIFISHLHGDHFFGLVGLISTFRLLNREKELHIYAPKGLKEIITLQLKISNSWTQYPLYFHNLEGNKSEIIFESEKIKVTTIPLTHRVYTNGFLFEEKIGLRKINIQTVEKYPEIEKCDYENLKQGKDFTLSNGTRLKNEFLTLPPSKPLSYAFCSDTSFNLKIVPLIKNIDCLYHESTFLTDKEDLAKTTMHSTAKQAAEIAKQANVKKLIIGHFSSRYKEKIRFLEEAKSIFDKTVLAAENKVFEIK